MVPKQKIPACNITCELNKYLLPYRYNLKKKNYIINLHYILNYFIDIFYNKFIPQKADKQCKITNSEISL